MWKSAPFQVRAFNPLSIRLKNSLRFFHYLLSSVIVSSLRLTYHFSEYKGVNQFRILANSYYLRFNLYAGWNFVHLLENRTTFFNLPPLPFWLQCFSLFHCSRVTTLYDSCSHYINHSNTFTLAIICI